MCVCFFCWHFAKELWQMSEWRWPPQASLALKVAPSKARKTHEKLWSFIAPNPVDVVDVSPNLPGSVESYLGLKWVTGRRELHLSFYAAQTISNAQKTTVFISSVLGKWTYVATCASAIGMPAKPKGFYLLGCSNNQDCASQSMFRGVSLTAPDTAVFHPKIEYVMDIMSSSLLTLG